MRVERLNLALSYPVQWGPVKILRDFIQNFYDSLGPENFGKDFEYVYDAESKILSMRSGKGFALDWLLYMGASTKRGDSQKAVGRYGEGFKIAALCAYRDLKWGVRMASRDWVVHVVETEDQIDGRAVPVLAYEVTEQEFKEEAVLILTGVSEKDFEDSFLRALKAFWWPRNPILGECIVSGDDFVVYSLPKGDTGRYGQLFAGYLARAPLDVPVIVCSHDHTAGRDTRERERFDSAEVDRCILNLIKKMSPAQAFAFLQAIPARWSGGKRRHDLGYDWDGIVKVLIERAAEDKEAVTEFSEVYAALIIADFPRERYGNRRGMALMWWRQSDFKKRKIVMHDFAKLGIPELNELCAAHGGYDATREPTEMEKQRIEILAQAAKDVFGALLCYDDDLPPVRITASPSPRVGAARCMPIKGAAAKKNGFVTKYEIEGIHLRKDLFRPGLFPEALATFLHELLHEYGGDGSGQFRRALTLMAGRCFFGSEELQKYEGAWDAIDTEGEDKNVGNV